MAGTKRSALGRGLGALIPSAPAAAPSAPSDAERGGVSPAGATVELPVASIAPNPQQPRREFADAELDALAESLRRHGLLQPVVVRRSPSRPDRYELVVGERRWRAAQRAGLERLPATIKDVATPELLEIALVENVQRQDLNAIELALAFRALCDADATQDEVGRRVGLDRSTVANHLRLLDLSRALQEDVEAGRLSVGHAKALLALPPDQRPVLRDKIVADGLSVRSAESLARSGAPAARVRKSPAHDAVDPNLAHLIDRMRDRFQTRVRISGSARRGRIELEFYGPEELNRLAAALLDGR